MKRTKNARKMHMVFNVQSGTVEVKMHENEFTVHRRGIWQVPRGEFFQELEFCVRWCMSGDVVDVWLLLRERLAHHPLVFFSFSSSQTHPCPPVPFHHVFSQSPNNLTPHLTSTHQTYSSFPGNTYSIRNIGRGTARVFFAQAMQTTVQDDE